MRKFWKNTKGAVTVFVTLLLIPAVLISGTAVDLARILTSRSVLQDANQLAANSVLTQYNALLYDLYGLFGVAEDDPILGKLLDDYIRVSVFGESAQDKTLGTLQLFYGSDLSLKETDFAADMDLENEAVLRRQIEEYMKFRGPVIIVKEVLEALDSNKIQADKEVIESKAEVDSEIIALTDKYKELYEAIVASDKCILPIGGISGGHFGTISSHMKLINAQFKELKECYETWESIDPEEDAEMKADYAAKYAAILENISAYATGGSRGSNWSNGRWATKSSGATGINSLIEGAKQTAINFKPKFDAVVDIARELDAMHGELSRKIEVLENKLNSSDCSEELKAGLTQKYGTPPMSIIERYKEILKWDNIEAMGKAYRDGGYNYIDNVFLPMLDDIRYRNSNSPGAASLSLDELTNIASNPAFALSESVSAASSRVAIFADFPENSVTISMPDGFKKFAEYPGENNAFFGVLKAMANQPQLDPVKLYDEQEDAEGSNAEEKQRNIIDALLKLVESAYLGLTNNPLGAKYLNDPDTPAPEKLGILDILKLIPKALSEPFISVIGDPAGALAKTGDYLLLLTYSTSSFSNYATARPESIGKTKDELSGIELPKSVTGAPLSPKVNYFFQSEWEYLYHGSQNAGANLSSVTRLLFLVRLICNYITVFSVNEVTLIVNSIQVSFAWAPPLGIFLGELARAAFAAAEALIDVAALRSGHKVPFLKNPSAGEWVCSPSGVFTAISKATAGAAVGDAALKNEKGLTYSNYMLFFFLTKAIFYFGAEGSAAAELAKRTGDLIEWNMINYEKKVNADEEKMAEALTDEKRFKLQKMKTGFSLTSTANMHMLFLSLPFALRGISGVIPPETMPLSATDYRGY